MSERPDGRPSRQGVNRTMDARAVMSNEYLNSTLNTQRSTLAPYTPQAIEVTIREGKPPVVILKGRRHRVREIINVWRLDEEWWRKPISRLYFLMELENSARITIFQDLGSGQWYRQNWA